MISTTTEEAYSSRIFRQLDFLLAELALSLDRFDLFAVNAGPGSFTGLRVGLTAAKAWSEVFGRPIVPVSGLEALAFELEADQRVVIPVLDARRGQLYAAMFGPGPFRGVQSSDGLFTPEEFMTWLRAKPNLHQAVLATTSIRWLNHTIGPDALLGFGLARREVSRVLAPAMAKLAYEKALRGESVDALRLEANYVRRSDAELNWKLT